MISVIIPYYQEKAGLLSRAIKSVYCQTFDRDIEVIVIDDGSPRRASDEIKDFSCHNRIHIRLLTQENRGPAAARNVGLNNIDARTEFIAFLDSDDEWTPDHLLRATSALAAGKDFYFSDFVSLADENASPIANRSESISDDKYETAFEKVRDFDFGSCHVLMSLDDIYEYNRSIYHNTTNYHFIYISTVVLRAATFSEIRFREDFLIAEDLTYWLDLAARHPAVCFSAKVECFRGKGVNIYASANWGSKKSLTVYYSSMKYLRLLEKSDNITNANRKIFLENISAVRADFLGSFIHLLRSGNLSCIILFLRFIAIDPMSAFLLIPTLLRLSLRKFSSI